MRTTPTTMLFSALVLLFLTAGCLFGGGRQIPECQDTPDGDACSACCSEHGSSGHMYNSFSEPPCSCM